MLESNKACTDAATDFLIVGLCKISPPGAICNPGSFFPKTECNIQRCRALAAPAIGSATKQEGPLRARPRPRPAISDDCIPEVAADPMKSFLIIAAILALLVLATLAYLFTPSVYAVRTVQGVTVHFETLGEYPSDIDRIEVVEHETRRMVWRVSARGEMFQLHQFQLVPGLNISRPQPSWGSVQTDIPAHGAFMLRRGVAYRASVCFRGWPYICRNADFIIASR